MPGITNLLRARLSSVWRLLCGAGRKETKPPEPADAFARWLREMESQNRTVMLGSMKERCRKT